MMSRNGFLSWFERCPSILTSLTMFPTGLFTKGGGSIGLVESDGVMGEVVWRLKAWQVSLSRTGSKVWF